ncbi:MAG: mechanosensitive ion channel family protein [Pelatocladus maniniholoensis HA4357-MV3]|jgi:small-conductance mechanosensitive channel|uniref:Mechanosensitive ion channel family protein n=1 Tax=Pelatocladus maniniholoensis HA4357-MV3 TaxID=1117104 RepID=A0A9E3H9L9_9NOST|nr:mechanosensitive ion channel family protein [Pelatocladus maniniholoensis HA4357-MV3]
MLCNLVRRKNQPFLTVILSTIVALLIVINPLSAASQSPSPDDILINQAPIKLGDQTLFFIQDKFFSPSLNERAERISSRIQQVANNYAIPVDALRTSDVEAEATTIIYAQDVAILSVSDTDAKVVKLTRQALANQYLQIIKNAITQYREERSAIYLIRATILAFVSTIILIIMLCVLGNVMPHFYHWLDVLHERWIPNIRIQNFYLLSSQQISAILQGFVRIINLIFVMNLLFFYLYFVLSFFPQTKHLADNLFTSLTTLLLTVWKELLGYIPNLFIITLIILLTRYFLSFLKFIFQNIEGRTLSIQGFYPEWAEPTYQLLKFLTIALAAIIAFPNLPGSNSPAFQAIFIVIGALISLSSGKLFANIIASWLLLYARTFQIGDRLQVEDLMGFVEDKDLLVTRIRTLNNVLVSIPNSVLLSSKVTNYSMLLREKQTPIIVHTTVTLGYDAPWRTVHETLIAAALATTDILSQPYPFVWQTALNDFYVSYELRAYTNHPIILERIYSELHQNIQDKCNEANIEICSPHYSAIRDGNQTTIPSEYVSGDYTAPGIRVNPLLPLINLINPTSPSTNSQSSTERRASD